MRLSEISIIYDSVFYQVFFLALLFVVCVTVPAGSSTFLLWGTRKNRTRNRCRNEWLCIVMELNGGVKVVNGVYWLALCCSLSTLEETIGIIDNFFFTTASYVTLEIPHFRRPTRDLDESDAKRMRGCGAQWLSTTVYLVRNCSFIQKIKDICEMQEYRSAK